MRTPILLTTNDIAKRLGVTPGRVRQLADARGLGQKLGNTRIFTEDDVAAMSIRRWGRPPKDEAARSVKC